jgi:hypothetical protein
MLSHLILITGLWGKELSWQLNKVGSEKLNKWPKATKQK